MARSGTQAKIINPVGCWNDGVHRRNPISDRLTADQSASFPNKLKLTCFWQGVCQKCACLRAKAPS